MATNQVTVVILTPAHSVTGLLTLEGRRLSDVLNDRNESVLTIRQAAIARLHKPGQVLEHHAEALIPKAWAVIAFEPPAGKASNVKRFYGFQQKRAHPVFMAMDGMEVRGLVHSTGEIDLRRYVTGLTELFLPVTQARVTLYADEEYRIEQEAVMVNANRVRYIAALGPAAGDKVA